MSKQLFSEQFHLDNIKKMEQSKKTCGELMIRAANQARP